MVDAISEHSEGDGRRSSEAAVLAAAERVFTTRGYEGARMQEIADVAGINKAMLHYYFRSKEKLFREVFRSVLDRALPPLVEALGSELPLGLKVRRFVDSYMDVLDRTPDLPSFILTELNRDPGTFAQTIRELAAPIFPVLGRQIEDAVAAGRIKSVSAEDLVVTLLSLCVFPYAARPLLASMCGMDEDAYRSFLQSRKAAVTNFVFGALRPDG